MMKIEKFAIERLLGDEYVRDEPKSLSAFVDEIENAVTERLRSLFPDISSFITDVKDSIVVYQDWDLWGESLDFYVEISRPLTEKEKIEKEKKEQIAAKRAAAAKLRREENKKKIEARERIVYEKLKKKFEKASVS